MNASKSAEDSPQKNGVDQTTAKAEPEEASGSARTFRRIGITRDASIPILSGRTGKPVTIKLKNLNNHEKEILARVCDFIEGKLEGTEYGEAIKIVMNVTGFCVTTSRHVGAYSVEVDDVPIVIFNSKTITGSTDELAVTVLHELLHFVTEPGDGDPASEMEARHDLACYGLLGIPVSLGHWAFAKFPHLKELVLNGERDALIPSEQN